MTYRDVGIFKTLWFNFRYLPLKQAVKLPFIFASNTRVLTCHKGFCKFNGEPRFGIVRIGFNRSYNNGCPCHISIDGTMEVNGNGNHSFGAGCRLVVKKSAILEIGNDFGCTGDTNITVFNRISIGDSNLWSYGCVVRDNDGHSIYDENGNIINQPKPIIFGDKIWMGCKCIVLKGSKIASNTIIAAGSRISGVLDNPNCIVTTGYKIIKANISWAK